MKPHRFPALAAASLAGALVAFALPPWGWWPLAFLGIWSPATLLAVMAANWFFKVIVEAVMTPVTTVVCAKLKQAEGVDAVRDPAATKATVVVEVTDKAGGVTTAQFAVYPTTCP